MLACYTRPFELKQLQNATLQNTIFERNNQVSSSWHRPMTEMTFSRKKQTRNSPYITASVSVVLCSYKAYTGTHSEHRHLLFVRYATPRHKCTITVSGQAILPLHLPVLLCRCNLVFALGHPQENKTKLAFGFGSKIAQDRPLQPQSGS